MSKDGFAKVVSLAASDVVEGDLLHTPSLAGMFEPWVEVRRVQRSGDGHVKLGTALSDMRMSPGMVLKVLRSEQRANGKWRAR